MKRSITAIIVFAVAGALGGCASLGGAAQATKSQAFAAAQSNALVVDDQFALATTTDAAEVSRLCANIAEHKANRDSAWENFKFVGGSALRFVAGVASVAGLPVAGALDVISGGVNAVEGYQKSVAAATTDSVERCRRAAE